MIIKLGRYSTDRLCRLNKGIQTHKFYVHSDESADFCMAMCKGAFTFNSHFCPELLVTVPLQF